MAGQSTEIDLVSTTVTSFEIIEVLRSDKRATIDDVAAELDIARSTAHRHLRTLVEYGFAEVDGNHYLIGSGFLKYGLLNSPERSAAQAFEVLEVLRELGDVTTKEVATVLDVPKPTAEQHLQLLERSEFVVSDGDCYQIGFKFLDFGIHARQALDYYETAQEQVDMLAKETDEKVRLIGTENGLSVLLYRVMGNHPLQTTSQIGNRRPLHQLAAGKSILAFLPRKKVEEIITRRGLPPRTENTITDPEVLFTELDEIRERGYGFNRQESIEGLNAVGAPFRNEVGRPIGALSISGPANRIKEDLLEKELPDLLMAATNEIEINLKYGDQ